MPGERDDVLPARRAVGPIIERIDLFELALDRLDAWADASGMAERLTVAGVSYWFQARESLWRWIHERLLWASVIDRIATGRTLTELVVPADDLALADVGRCLAASGRTGLTFGPSAGSADLEGGVGPSQALVAGRSGTLSRLFGAPSRRRRRAASDGRSDVLDRRIAAMAGRPTRKVLVLSHAGIRQVVDTSAGPKLADPNLGAIIQRLPEHDLEPIVIGLGLDHRLDADWPTIEADESLLPFSLLQTRWRGDEDPAADVQAIVAGLEAALDTPLALFGIDLGPLLVAEIRTFATRGVDVSLRQAARVGRLLGEIRPRAVLLSHEGIRLAWLVAAARQGVATFAVQHGVIYPTHPGYRHGRSASLVLPTRTFVFGDYEAGVLIDFGGYRPDEVMVGGSPRLDLAGPDLRDLEPDPGRPARTELRRSLGVRDADRMLVVSTTFSRFIRDSHFAHMLERTLGGPLPGVHVVFKQHPGEQDDGPYAALLTSLARAGAYQPPAMSVVRDIDLLGLLRAADAHLGSLSTVLTDAVVAGTTNLIASVEAHGDLLGYVPARVAIPVVDVDEVRSALERAEPPAPADRQAFLADHFRPGDAGSRIASAIAAYLEGGALSAAGSAIELRAATFDDATTLLDWANDPTSRWASSDRPVIAPGEHEIWLTRRLSDPDRYRIWIGQCDGQAVGVVRVERAEDGDAEVSITVAPERRGRGVGTVLLARGAEATIVAFGGVRLRARIRADNPASLALFTGAGFRRTAEDPGNPLVGAAIVEVVRDRT